MQVTRYSDPKAFLARVEDFLVADEARNTVPLGLAERLAGSVDGADAVHMACAIDEDGAVAGVVVRTNADLAAGLSTVSDAEAIIALVDDLADLDPPPIGLSGLRPSVDMAAERLAQHLGRRVEQSMANRLFVLTAAEPPAAVSGRMRRAVAGDRDLLVSWIDAFLQEALPHEYRHGRSEVLVDRRLAEDEPGMRIWDVDGTPACLAAAGNRTPNCERIGPVYTPPEYRRHGYAGALVAALCQERLDAGRRMLTLYTDLANPTSNHIYTQIGFRPVADAALLLLE